MRLADAEAAAQGRLDRARALLAQYEDTITELSQDASALTAGAQSLREENSGLSRQPGHCQGRGRPLAGGCRQLSVSESMPVKQRWQVKR